MWAAVTRGRLATGVALAAIAAVIVVVIVSTRPPSSPASASGQSSGGATASVTRRNLVQTDTESGTLSYSDPQTVYNRLSGTITALPAVGQVIRAGQALFSVDGKPVLLMDGTTPAYRDLGSSDSDGSDILQLNRNLVALGFNPGGIVVDDAWQAATTDGVDLLQASLGETETGKLILGQIVFLPGPQLVSALDTGIGSTGTGGGGSSASTHAVRARGARQPDDAVRRPRPARAAARPGKPGTSTHPVRGRAHRPAHPSAEGGGGRAAGRHGGAAGRARLLGRLVRRLVAVEVGLRVGEPVGGVGVRADPVGRRKRVGRRSGGSGGSGSGSGAGSSAGTAILQTSSARLLATVDLDASKQSEARVGEHVSVELPSGTTITGVVSAVSSVAQSSSGSGSGGSGAGGSGSGGSGSGGSGSSGSSSATVPVTISLPHRLPGAGLDQAAVSVGFVEAVADNVLSVPVTALLATGGGAYAVQEAAAPHHLIPVSTGLFAAGYVQVSGPGVYQGLSVTNSQG